MARQWMRIAARCLAFYVAVEAVAYITNDPILRITKTATPDPVVLGNNLLYTIRVENLGWQASGLVVTDTLPANSTYVTGSASGFGQFAGGELRWELAVLPRSNPAP